MSKIFIDYSLMSNASSKINTITADNNNYINKVSNTIDDLLRLDDNHNNALGVVEGDLDNTIKDLENANNLLNDLSSDINMVTTEVLKAEISGSNELDILNNKYHISEIESRNITTKLFEEIDNKPLADLISKNEVTKPLTEEEWNRYKKLYTNILSSAKTEREKSAASALFMTTVFPRLPYFWGGGHEKNIVNGLDTEWGTAQKILATGSSSQPVGSENIYSYDCSGFVSWSLKNGGYNLNNSKVVRELVDDEATSTNLIQGDTTAKIGDLVYTTSKDHVGIIVGKHDNELIVAHCSGSGKGMNLTTMSTETGLVTSDSNNQSRLNTPYFNDVAHLKYDDE